MTPTAIAAIFLAMAATGGVAYALLYPYLSGDIRGEKRHKAITAAEPAKRRVDRAAGASRRDAIAQSLKEIEKKERAEKKLTLEMRIAHAGLSWSKKQYIIVSIIVGVIIAAVASIGVKNVFLGVLAGVAAGAALPLWYLMFLRSRRMKKFQDEFPNAVDIIVRGVKSGLPLGDCLRIISIETAEPVKSEFRKIIEAQSIGLSLGEACGKLYKNMPTSEANFFGIVIQIQSKTGGSLADALSNLSRVLRERKKMKGKISAMSMEAKASAAIIGALPFIVAGLVTLTTPSYMVVLFTTMTGKIMIAAGLFWMFLGIMVMRKMIRFDF
ncbi:type II secretion system F family protein [Terrarubrum flagellatum]|uniref:type II secretion system F family protein n=1 Tax=Terrirubrum flagellatum TaxID=2895980 RepID=UPI0031455723